MSSPRSRRYDDDHDEPVPPSTSGMAITSLILGIAGMVLCPIFIPSLLAILFGFLGINNINSSRGRVQGKGLAIAGLIMGCVGIAVSLGTTYFTYYAFQRVGTKANEMRSMGNLKQLGIAMHDYHNDMTRLPKAAICDKDGKPLLSWRVAMLPYVEADNLYKQFKLDEPWDSPHNIKLLPEMPKVFANPRFPNTAPDMTYYRVFIGEDAVFPYSRGKYGDRTLGQLTVMDGSAGTLLIVEAGEPVPWTKPDELLFTKDGPLPPLGGPSGELFLFTTADGAAYRARKSVDPAKIRALIGVRDGIAVDPMNLD